MQPTANRDDTRTLLLTGCCGYIGAWSTVKCLRAGYRVRGTSQAPDYARRLFDEVFAAEPDGPALNARLEIVPAELLDADSWTGLADDCWGVVHIACPVLTATDTPSAEMLDPALVGTENVLREAARAGSVERVIYMSSITALIDHHRRVKTTEPESVGPEDWNETSSPETDPYAYAKVHGERLARRMTAELGPRATFASVLPGAVIGPPVAGERVSASVHKAFDPLLSGQLRFGSVDLALGVVDVRDVAETVVGAVGLDGPALAELGERARFICVSPPTTRIQDLADAMRRHDPSLGPRLPKRALPLPRCLLLAIMRVSVDREAFSYARAMLGRRVEFRADLPRQRFGIAWRTIESSVADTLDWMKSHP